MKSSLNHERLQSNKGNLELTIEIRTVGVALGLVLRITAIT